MKFKVKIEHIKIFVEILVVIGTFVMAIAAFRQIQTTVSMERESRRPWLNIQIVETKIDMVENKAEVVVELNAVPDRDPARFVQCYAWVTPEGAGSSGGGVSLQSSVVLPGQSIQSERYPCLVGLKYFDLVFKHHEEAKLRLECRYGMLKEFEFHTEKTFILKNQEYVEDFLKTSFE